MFPFDDVIMQKEPMLFVADMCTTDDVFRPFWDRMQDKCVESYAMKEVFNMESSVRVQAIENLGKAITLTS